jgi:hypothetical protein
VGESVEEQHKGRREMIWGGRIEGSPDTVFPCRRREARRYVDVVVSSVWMHHGVGTKLEEAEAGADSTRVAVSTVGCPIVAEVVA